MACLVYSASLEKKQKKVVVQFPLQMTLADASLAAFSQMVTEVFGNILYYPETAAHMKEFPSPESLKNRVILSTKPPKEYLEAKSFKEKDFEHSDSKKKNEETAWGKEVSDLETEIESAAKVTILSISMVYYSSCF